MILRWHPRASFRSLEKYYISVVMLYRADPDKKPRINLTLMKKVLKCKMMKTHWARRSIVERGAQVDLGDHDGAGAGTAGTPGGRRWRQIGGRRAHDRAGGVAGTLGAVGQRAGQVGGGLVHVHGGGGARPGRAAGGAGTGRGGHILFFEELSLKKIEKTWVLLKSSILS